MIHARSPYIIYDDTTNLERIEFRLYIYKGTKDTDKGTADYEFAIDAVNGEVQFDISPFIREKLVAERISPYFVTDAFLWVTTEISRDTGAGLSAFSAYEETQLACYGYTLPSDGVNYTTYTENNVFEEGATLRYCAALSSAAAYPVEYNNDLADPWNNDLLTHWFVKKEGETMRIPFLRDNYNNGDLIVRFYDGLNVTGNLRLTLPLLEADRDESTNTAAVIIAPDDAVSFEVRVDGGLRITKGNFLNIDGPCDQLKRVMFINRYGVPEEMHLIGRAKESYSVEEDRFKRTILSGGSYATWEGQSTAFNKRAKKRVEISSGLYPEGYNEQFKQLLLSERVWIRKDEFFAGQPSNWEAVYLIDSDIEYKYSKYEKKIEYTFTFEYANSEINDIA